MLDGLKLIGFAIWERRSGGGRNVTFPARQYAVNGERRSFALLRPIADATAQDRIRDLVLQAYAEYQANDRGKRSRLTRFACFRTPPCVAASGGVKNQDHGTASLGMSEVKSCRTRFDG